MNKPTVSILIPHYKTLALTKLCLNLIKQYTDLTTVSVIVIDNDSQDGSVPFLKTLDWIQLIERQAIPGESPVQSHSRALDMALDTVTSPYVLSIHTDTLVKRADWLTYLLEQFANNPQIAAVGSWKLEAKSWWRNALKWAERKIQRLYYYFTHQTQHGLEGIGKNYYYLRSHCAMYRTNLLRELNLHFSDGDMVAGKAMHASLQAKGYQLTFLSSDALIPYVEHLNHATTVMNPTLSTREKSVIKGRRRIEKTLAKLQAKAIID